MRKINLLVWLLSICIIGILTEACKIAEGVEDLCANGICQNGGTCIEGNCDCPTGFIGANCENFDHTQVQALLDAGQSPINIVNKGIPLDSLYGKIYKNGLIFYLNEEDGTGLLAALSDYANEVSWGCPEKDIVGLNNVETEPTNPETEEGTRIGDGQTNTDAILNTTNGCDEMAIAAAVCRELGVEWFLPSRDELDLIFTNLHFKAHSDFVGDWYWNSTEYDDNRAWNQFFGNGIHGKGGKGNSNYIRAARSF